LSTQFPPGDRFQRSAVEKQYLDSLWEVYGKEGFLRNRCVKVLNTSKDPEALIKIAKCLPKRLGPEEAQWIQEHLGKNSPKRFVEAAKVFEIKIREQWSRRLAECLSKIGTDDYSPNSGLIDIAQALPDATPEEVLDIQERCGENTHYFGEAFKAFGSDPKLATRVADALGKSKSGFDFNKIVSVLPEATPEEVLDIQERCGENTHYFGEAFKAFGSDPELATKVADALGKSKSGNYFNKIASVLPEATPEDVLDIQERCGENAHYFGEAFKAFGSDPKLATRVADALGKSKSGSDFNKIASALPEATPEKVLDIQERCGENAFVFAKAFKAFGSDPELATKVADVAGKCDESLGSIERKNFGIPKESLEDLLELLHVLELPKIYSYTKKIHVSDIEFLAECIQNIPRVFYKDAAKSFGWRKYASNSRLIITRRPFEFISQMLPHLGKSDIDKITQWDFEKRRTFYGWLVEFKAYIGDDITPSTLINKAMQFADSGISYIPRIIKKYSVSFDMLDQLCDQEVIGKIKSFEPSEMNFDKLLPCIKKATDQRDFLLKIDYGLDFDEAALEGQFKIDLSDPIWSDYVIRKKGWGKGYGYRVSDKQNLYGHMMRQSVQISAVCLKNYEWSFDQLLDYSASRRSLIANKVGHLSPYKYGLFRNGPSFTPCSGSYLDLAKRLMKLHASSPSNYEVEKPTKNKGVTYLKGVFLTKLDDKK